MTPAAGGRRAAHRPVGSRRPGVDLANLPRRVRADLWPLLVTVAVVAVVVAVADAGPRLLRTVADETVRTAVEQAADTALIVTAPFPDDFRVVGRPPELTAEQVTATAAAIADALPPDLAPLFDTPVATVATIRLPLVVPDGRNEASLRLAYVWDGTEDAVEWLEGGPPVAGDPGTPWTDGAVWPVQVGVSAGTSALLGVGPGDRVDVSAPTGLPLDVTVSGVFRPRDADDPRWADVPDLLDPRTRGSGFTTRTEVAAYLSAESLPAARFTLDPRDTTATYRLAVRPSALDHAAGPRVATGIAALEADPAAIGLPGPGVRVTSRLDTTLVATQARIAAGGSQAAVLLVGLVATGAAVLILTAHVLTRRRSVVLAQARSRGASVPAIAASALAESLLVAAVGGALGRAVSSALVPGPPSWPWIVTALAVVLLASPVLAAWSVVRGDDRRRPADRHRHRAARRVRTVRRGALEGGVVLLAVAALTGLRSRGLPTGAADGPDLLLSAAPALVALAGALLAHRALPALLGGLLAAARRSRRAGPMLAAARAHAAGAGALAFVVLVLATSLLGTSATLSGTVRSGQVSGSWDTVGADVRIRAQQELDPAAIRDLTSAPGVALVTAARSDDTVQLFGARDHDHVRLLAVAPVEFARLLAATPFEEAPQLVDLTEPPAPGSAVPVLVGPELAEEGGLSLLWQGSSVPVTVVGASPGPRGALGPTDADQGRPTVVVNAAALGAATGEPVGANVVWVVGPGADEAVTAAAWPGATVTSRADWLTARGTEPLAAGLLRLIDASLVLFFLLAVVAVVLSASVGAPERSTSLAAYRVLGVGRGGAAAVALGELAPPVVAAGVTGVALGTFLAAASVGPLALHLVTGQSAAPDLVLPWWALAGPGVLVGVVALVVAVESSTRRREGLGLVLRAGGV